MTKLDPKNFKSRFSIIGGHETQCSSFRTPGRNGSQGPFYQYNVKEER